MLEEQKFLRRGFRFAAEMQRVRAEKIGVESGGSFHGECAAGKTSVFAQLESFVVRLRARRIENQDAEGVARPAVIAKKALEARLLDAGLLVNGDGRAGGAGSRGFAQARVISLGAAQDGIDERGSSGAEIERGDGSAVTGFQQRLGFRRREEQLVGTVGVVVQKFDTREERAGGLPVDAVFETGLRGHLERYRMAGYDLEVDGPRFVPLEIALLVCVLPDYFRAHVTAAVLDVLCFSRCSQGGAAAAAAIRAETCSIFLCSRLDSGYLRKKPRHEPPRKNASTSGRELNSWSTA